MATRCKGYRTDTNQHETAKSKEDHTMSKSLQTITECVRPWFSKETTGAWTAVATFLIASFTYLLYQVANDTNTTAQAIQRAYVNAGRIESGVAIFEGGVITAVRIDVPWNNSGTTPARNTSSIEYYII